MNFLFLGIFSRFFWIKFTILMLKLNNKKCHKGLLIRAGPTWMQRGMQGHVAVPQWPTRRLRGMMWRIYIYLYSLIICIAFRLSEGIINSLNTLQLINPTFFLNFSRVGLSSTRLLYLQDTWQKLRPWIERRINHRASITWTRGPPITIKTRALMKGIITALMKRLRGASRPSDRDPRGANQGVL